MWLSGAAGAEGGGQRSSQHAAKVAAQAEQAWYVGAGCSNTGARERAAERAIVPPSVRCSAMAKAESERKRERERELSSPCLSPLCVVVVVVVPYSVVAAATAAAAAA